MLPQLPRLVHRILDHPARVDLAGLTLLLREQRRQTVLLGLITVLLAAGFVVLSGRL